MPSPYEAKLQRHRNKIEDVTTCVATATSCHRHGNASYLSTRSHVHSCPRLSSDLVLCFSLSSPLTSSSPAFLSLLSSLLLSSPLPSPHLLSSPPVFSSPLSFLLSSPLLFSSPLLSSFSALFSSPLLSSFPPLS